MFWKFPERKGAFICIHFDQVSKLIPTPSSGEMERDPLRQGATFWKRPPVRHQLKFRERMWQVWTLKLMWWSTVLFFRFWAPNSGGIFALTQANFEANSADILHITQNFGILGQKTAKIVLTQLKLRSNSAKFCYNSAKNLHLTKNFGESIDRSF